MTIHRLLHLHSCPALAEFPDAAPLPPGHRRSLVAAHAGGPDSHALDCLVLAQSAVHHMPATQLVGPLGPLVIARHLYAISTSLVRTSRATIKSHRCHQKTLRSRGRLMKRSVRRR
jgi:hypothetical protein